jgi:hypothetical protein
MDYHNLPLGILIEIEFYTQHSKIPTEFRYGDGKEMDKEMDKQYL